MNRRLLLGIMLGALGLVLVSVIVWFAADNGPRRQAALTESKTLLAEKWLLYEEPSGNFLGAVDSVHGCTIQGAVVETLTGQGQFVEKNPGQASETTYAPCTFSFDLSMGAALWNWIKASFNPQQPNQQQQQTKSFLLAAATRDNSPVSGIEIKDAFVSDFGFARQAKKDLKQTDEKGDLGFRFELTLTPTSLKRKKPQSLSGIPTKALAPATGLELSISGIQNQGVVDAVGPWTARRDVIATKTAGSAGGTSIHLSAGSIDAGELEFVVPSAKAEGIEKWFDDSVVQSATVPKKTARLKVLASTGATALELNFTGVGIFKAEDAPTEGQVRYWVYLEGMSLAFFGLPAAPVTTTPLPPPPPTSPPPATTETSPPSPPPPPPAEETTPETKTLEAPGRLQAEPTDSGIVLTWAAVAEIESYVVLSSKQTGGPYEELAKTSEPTHTLGRLEPGTYYFVVRSVLGENQSEDSLEVTAEVP